MALIWLIQSIFLFTIIICVCIVDADGIYDTRNTTHGMLRGRVDYSGSVPVSTFFGIPFAKAPAGSLRFKPPDKVDSWDGVRDALQFGNECFQRNSIFRFNNSAVPTTQSEDCLFLNVYTPSQVNSQSALPVMVWIHGGGFFAGAGSQYDGTSLARKGVILVTINYRLDSFGFLSTEDYVMPGNYGMLDQIAALKWVNKNIAAFGGDPNSVTIFGESAGSASVSLLILSPLAKGLFQRAIMESGVSVSAWATAHPGNRVSPRIMARLIGMMVDCKELDNTTHLMSCLQQVDAETLQNASNAVVTAVDYGFYLVPRVETTFGFLPDLPINLLARGEFSHVDTIRGFNTDEMGGGFAQILTNSTITYLKSAIETVLHIFDMQFTTLDRNNIYKLIESSYIDWTSSHDTIIKQAMDSNDDQVMIGPMIKEMAMYIPGAAERKHYMYEFNHLPSFKKGLVPSWMYANHVDEIAYVFNVSAREFREDLVFAGPPEDVDILISDQMMEMWTNFAKTGEPTPSVTTGGVKWEPYSLTTPNYLFIKEKSELKTWSRPQALQLFDRIVELLDGIKPQDGATDIVG